MLKEGIQTKFVQSFLALARVAVAIQDDFFVAKMEAVLSRILAGYVKFKTGKFSSPTHDVAQYLEKDFLEVVDGALEILEDLRYLKKASDTPLLDAQKIILELKLEIIATKSSQVLVDGDKLLISEVASEKEVAKSNSTLLKNNHSLNTNQEKILRFLVAIHRARTKEIVDEFSSLSERTVKRNLKELLSQGLVERRSENKAVFYSPALP